MFSTVIFLLIGTLVPSRLESTTTIYPADVVLFEGILMFYQPEIRNLFHMKLFVDSDADTRLARRGGCWCWVYSLISFIYILMFLFICYVWILCVLFCFMVIYFVYLFINLFITTTTLYIPSLVFIDYPNNTSNV